VAAPHRTALGNVAEALTTVRRIAPAEARERGLAQLRKVGLEAHADHIPAQLSGGQQQRMAIARALALEPQIMLFDEPTSSLDPELTGEVLNVMRALASEGMTMIVVSHEIGFAASVANRIVFLDGGRLLLNGTPKEVFGHPRHPRLEQFLERFAFRLQCIQNLGSSWSTRRGGQRRVQSRQLRGRRQRCAPLPRAYGV
jgi:polar amino acid transport system ATP-binding protein